MQDCMVALFLVFLWNLHTVLPEKAMAPHSSKYQYYLENSLVVQLSELCTSTVWGMGLKSGCGIQIPHAGNVAKETTTSKPHKQHLVL